MRASFFRSLSCVIIFTIGISGCHFISNFDTISYKNLTDLKGEMKVTFESYSVVGAKGEKDSTVLERYRTITSQGYEYEKGKAKNDNTIAQWETINSLVGEVIQRYKKDGKNELSPGYCEGKWKILETAFDIAIATENGKLK
jgi:hypothetical protein